MVQWMERIKKRQIDGHRRMMKRYVPLVRLKLMRQIFRRLMVLQRRKAEHAALVSHEQETGGSDPIEPDFWEDELDNLDTEERELARMVSRDRHTPKPISRSTFASSSSFITPRQNSRGGGDVEMGMYRDHSDIEEDWAEEAAAAEEAEREAEEMEMLERVEREYAESLHNGGGGNPPSAEHTSGQRPGDVGDTGGMDIDWDGFDQMDME